MVTELQAATAAEDIAALLEEHAVEGGLVWDAVDDAGKVTVKSATASLRSAKAEGEAEMVELTGKLVELLKAEAAAKKAAKEGKTALDEATLKRYAELDESDVKDLVITKKWGDDLALRITGEVEACFHRLQLRLGELTARYSVTVSVAERAVAEASARMTAHLTALGMVTPE